MPRDVIPISELLACPSCGSGLPTRTSAEQILCSGCGESFGCEDGIPLLYRSSDFDAVAEPVRSFYEQNPFPNYDDLDSSASLASKARRGRFAHLLDEGIPARAKILEVGCGTGQLSNFLARVPDRGVVAIDFCLNSLKLAQAFKQENGLDNVTFAQMNLFRPALTPESFDVVLCNGVLHHTESPEQGFLSISRLVRPRGFLIVGLYNTWGRWPTDLRRKLFRLSGGRLHFLDPHLRNPAVGPRRKHSWLMDQYYHPHESKHSMGEVIGWFAEHGFDFVHSLPSSRPFQSFSSSESLFALRPPGTPLDRFMVQLGMLLSGGREGGLFVMIGRKVPEDGGSAAS